MEGHSGVIKGSKVMFNEVRDHVGCLKVLVSISEQRQTEGMFGCFASIYLILETGKIFIEQK